MSTKHHLGSFNDSNTTSPSGNVLSLALQIRGADAVESILLTSNFTRLDVNMARLAVHF